jgi:Ser/Thr protein kinase RdoA (MazF antagonist)
MKAFEDLTRRGQMVRLRRMAEKALEAYGLEEARLTRLHYAHNMTFRVDVRSLSPEASPPQGRPDAGVYVLRIHRPGYQETASIRSELLWLKALRTDVGLCVPEPVPTQDRRLLTTVSVAGVPEARHCVLFRWISGRFLRHCLRPSAFTRLGAFVARMHRYAECHPPPEGFVRKRWDCVGLTGAELGVDLARARAVFAPEDLAVLEATTVRVQKTLQELGEGRDVFGVIHADLNPSNCLLHKGEVRAIDFDDCGWGYFLYDIAVALGGRLRGREDFPQFQSAFLEGYRGVRPLSAAQEALLPTFWAVRSVMISLWFAGHAHEPVFRARASQILAGEVAFLRTYLAET